MTIQTEAQSLSPTALVEMFVLDLGIYSGGTLHFCSTQNPIGGDVTWQGQVYTAIPIEASGFSRSGQGTLPRPKIKVSNYQGLMAAQARNFSDLVGCKVIRRRTYARFLDAVNFSGGNPSADSSQHYPDETWIIDRRSSETPVSIEFELAAPFDLPGVQLPLRQYLNNTCAWVYRGSDCGYTGGAVATETGVATSDLSKDACGGRLSDCKLRSNVVRYGAFPGSGITGI